MPENKNINSDKPAKESPECKGLILINTGSGKGKTTAAIGCALRSAGHKQKVLILQYIKGTMNTGELKSIEQLKPYIEIFQLGKGFIKYKKGKPFITEDDKKDARQAYEFSIKKVKNDSYDLIILDEIINLLNFGLISFEEVKKIIFCRPDRSSIILTGSDAPMELIELADTVTEMKEIKHAFQKGISAKKGIEF
ncbi:MAG: cob(I)yrinic acid a,c-diamide adenosyltransferase [Candidatus Humimicrobiaceae bacterium]